MNIYQEILMDHYRHPRNRVRIANADFASEQHNPSCGDSVHFSGSIVGNAITRVGFEGKGCVISQAAASLLTESVIGKTVDQVLVWDAATMLALLGMQLGPVRIKCALLPLQALQQGLREYCLKKEGMNAQSCQGSPGVTKTYTG